MNRDAQILQAAECCVFGARYLELCAKYSGVDDALRLRKADVNSAVLELFKGAMFDSKSKIYYLDLSIVNAKVRLCIPYVDGFVDPWYIFQIPEESYRYMGGFNQIAESQSSLIREFLPAKFPCVRNKEEVLPIYNDLSILHYDFIHQLTQLDFGRSDV